MSTACVFDLARRRGIHVVTWDGSATHPDGLTFSHDLPATEVPLDEAWLEASRRELRAEEIQELNAYLRSWSQSENTPFPYNPTPLEDAGAIKELLGIRSASRVVVAYTNTAWDIAVIDRDVGFDSMFDWLFSLVDYAAGHPEVDLVVRAHPAETRVPVQLRSRSPVGPEIKKRYRPLPDNVRLVDGDSPISSYALSRLAHVNVFYATRLGLELALNGIEPWIAGDVTYRGKGFTLDLESRDHMYELLDAGAVCRVLSADEVSLAQRFAHLWFFRAVVRLPLLRTPDKQLRLESFRQLGPGGDAVLDRLCDAIVSRRSFIDIGAPTR
jgi:hypothetical protein